MDVAVIAKEIKRDDLLHMYYYLKLTRALEDRITALYRQGRIVGGVYTSHGMEANAVGYASALERDDIIAPFHRDMGAFALDDLVRYVQELSSSPLAQARPLRIPSPRCRCSGSHCQRR